MDKKRESSITHVIPHQNKSKSQKVNYAPNLFQIDIFGVDILLIPVHHDDINHWSLCAVFVNEKKISFFDSLNRRGDDVLEVIIV